MKKFAVIAAALALTACGPREEEAGGEVVDTLNTPNIEAELGIPGDTARLHGADSTMDSIAFRRSTGVGRKPVDMKDSTRRP